MRYILRHTTMAYNSMRNILKSTNKAIIADFFAETLQFFVSILLSKSHRPHSQIATLLESNKAYKHLYINNIATQSVRRFFLDFYLVRIFLCYYFAT